MEFTFSIDQMARVHLTPWAKEKLISNWISCGRHNSKQWKSLGLEEDGTYTTQLWRIMNIFGPSLSSGSINFPFENNEIVILDNDEM